MINLSPSTDHDANVCTVYGRVNLTEIPKSFVAFPYNHDGHKKGDIKDFKKAMKTAWIVMTGFGKSTAARKLDLHEKKLLASEHSCIRAYSPSDPTSTGRGLAGLLPTMSALAAAILAVSVGVFTV